METERFDCYYKSNAELTEMLTKKCRKMVDPCEVQQISAKSANFGSPSLARWMPAIEMAGEGPGAGGKKRLLGRPNHIKSGGGGGDIHLAKSTDCAAASASGSPMGSQKGESTTATRRSRAAAET